jgi:hypothetical protein
VLFVLLLGLLPRLPLLYNAAALIGSDEAVNALTIRHLLAGEARLHPWDVTYFGLTEGLLALPFVAVLGFTPLAFKLVAVAGFLVLLAAVFLLGREIYGSDAGLAAAALLALFSPQVVRWSTMAASGFTLIVAWGTLTLLWVERLRRRPARGPELFACGCFAGLGLYTYELYLVYLLTLACAGSILGAAWLARRALPVRLGRGGGPHEQPRETGRRLRAGLSAALWLAAGFALGWAPKLAVLLHRAALGSREPGYSFASSAQVAHNARLLGQCLLALLGANPGADPALLDTVGAAGSLAAALGAVLLAIYLVAWLDAARRVLLGTLRGPARGLTVEALLVLLVPVNLTLFLLGTNPQDIHSNRYLLPMLSSLPVLAGGLLVRLARRSAVAAGGLAVVMLGLPAAEIYRWQIRSGVLDARLRPVAKHEALFDVLSYLKMQGIHGAYAEYWTCYKATFLARERVLVAPLLTWDRYPAYGRQVDALAADAYIFHSRFPGGWHGEAQLVEELHARGRPFTVRTAGAYRVYAAPAGRGPCRLLPPPLRPVPLARPGALVTVVRPMTAVPAGAEAAVPLVLANRGASPWSAAGLGPPFPAGLRRVEVAYRWLDRAGRTVIAEGEASLLPRDLEPGAAIPLVARMPAPARAGSYLLLLYAIQAGVPGAAAQDGAAIQEVRVAGAGAPMSPTLPQGTAGGAPAAVRPAAEQR